MRKLIGLIVLVVVSATAQSTLKSRTHPDYVPNQQTAIRIAEAVLVGQFGEARVSAQLPLQVRSTSKDLWLVEGTIRNGLEIGGNFGVWINKHTGCVKVIEHAK